MTHETAARYLVVVLCVCASFVTAWVLWTPKREKCGRG